MERVLNYLFLEYCTAWTRGYGDLARWYLEAYVWLVAFNDELEATSQEMASGTESNLRQAER